MVKVPVGSAQETLAGLAGDQGFLTGPCHSSNHSMGLNSSELLLTSPLSSRAGVDKERRESSGGHSHILVKFVAAKMIVNRCVKHFFVSQPELTTVIIGWGETPTPSPSKWRGIRTIKSLTAMICFISVSVMTFHAT